MPRVLQILVELDCLQVRLSLILSLCGRLSSVLLAARKSAAILAADAQARLLEAINDKAFVINIDLVEQSRRNFRHFTDIRWLVLIPPRKSITTRLSYGQACCLPFVEECVRFFGTPLPQLYHLVFVVNDIIHELDHLFRSFAHKVSFLVFERVEANFDGVIIRICKGFFRSEILLSFQRLVLQL